MDETKEPILSGVKTILMSVFLQNLLHNSPIFFLVLTEMSPMNGSLQYVLFSLFQFSLGVPLSNSLLFRNNYIFYQLDREDRCFSPINV